MMSGGRKEVTQAGMFLVLANHGDFEKLGQGPLVIIGWRSHKFTRSTMHGEA